MNSLDVSLGRPAGNRCEDPAIRPGPPVRAIEAVAGLALPRSSIDDQIILRTRREFSDFCAVAGWVLCVFDGRSLIMGGSEVEVTVRVGNSLDASEIPVWEGMDSLSRVGRICSSHPWTEVAAKSDGIPTTFFRVYASGRLVAGATGDLMPAGIPDHYNTEGLLSGNTITKGIPPWSPDSTLMPCMTATTRAGKSADIRVAADLTDGQREQYVKELFTALRDHGQAHGAKATALVFTPHESALVQAAATATGFVGTPITESYYMELDFSSFAEYLERFPSHKRANIRRERAKATGDPNVTFSVKLLSEAMEVHARFAAMNFGKYGETALTDIQRLQARAELIVEQFGDNARVIEMFIDGERVGNAQYTRYGDAYYTRTLGFLPDAPSAYAPYFNLAYYQLAEEGIADGVERIVYGHELGATKLGRGCTAEVQDLWLCTEDEPARRRVEQLRDCIELPSLQSRSAQRRMVTAGSAGSES